MTARARAQAPAEAKAAPFDVWNLRRNLEQRLWPALEAAAVLAGIIFALVYWMRLPGRLPTEDDYLAVQHELVSRVHAGDGVALLPFWADRGKLFVHGLPVIALPNLASEGDIERYPRLWVLAQPDLPRSEASRVLAELDQKLTRREPPKRFGPLSLSLYEPKEGRAGSYDFAARLLEAQVDIGRTGGADPQACEAVNGGFRCPRAQWNYVAPEWHEFDFLPRRCLWAPPVGTQPLEIHYSQVTMAGGVRGGFALIGGAAEARQLAPVDLSVEVDGQLAVLELSPGDPGWHPFELAWPQLPPGAHDVTFRVTAADPAQRHFCFDASAF
jgi:hypothetical protein